MKLSKDERHALKAERNRGWSAAYRRGRQDEREGNNDDPTA